VTTVCGTGHRPEDSEDEQAVRIKVRTKLRYTNKTIDTFITGMAAGFDLWAGDEALGLGIPIIAAVPWRGHAPRTSDEALYQKLLDNAKEVVYVTDVDDYPGPWVYHKRNEWMVDHADLVLAYWSGKEKGGTFACYQYAKKKGKPVANVYFDPPF